MTNRGRGIRGPTLHKNKNGDGEQKKKVEISRNICWHDLMNHQPTERTAPNIVINNNLICDFPFIPLLNCANETNSNSKKMLKYM
jgi:hypothetical protein